MFEPFWASLRLRLLKLKIVTQAHRSSRTALFTIWNRFVDLQLDLNDHFSEFASVQGNNNSKRLAVFTFQGPKPAHPSVPGHVVSLSLKLSMTHSPSVPGHVVSLSLKSLSAITFPFGGFGCFGCLVSSGFGGFGVFGGFGGFVFLSSSSVSSSSSWCLAPIQWSSSVQWAQQWHNLKFEMSHYLKTKIKCNAIKAIGLHVGDLHAWTSLSSWCPSRDASFHSRTAQLSLTWG